MRKGQQDLTVFASVDTNHNLFERMSSSLRQVWVKKCIRHIMLSAFSTALLFSQQSNSYTVKTSQIKTPELVVILPSVLSTGENFSLFNNLTFFACMLAKRSFCLISFATICYIMLPCAGSMHGSLVPSKGHFMYAF